MPLKLSVLLSLILIFAISEGSFASGKRCADVFQVNSDTSFNNQNLAEKVETFKQVLVRLQGELATEKNSLVASHAVDPKIAAIVANGSKGYAQGYYEVPGLPSRQLTNAEITEQVTLEINNSQVWKQKISKMDVEALLYYGSAVHSGAPDTSYVALLLNAHGGEAPPSRM